jgi:DNA-binding transcriptional ArsR family regulator
LAAETKESHPARELHTRPKALAHPLRVQALTILNKRVASPSQIAQELNRELSQVVYHMNVLKEHGCIELVRTEPRRGAVEHFYRATARAFLADSEWAQLPESVRPGMSAKLVQAIFNEAAAALEVGIFDTRDERHVSWTPMAVDEEGWKTLVEVLSDSLERVLATQAASSARLAASGEKGIPVSISMLGFPSIESDEVHIKPKNSK